MRFQTTQQFLRGSVRRTILVSTSGVELVECLLSWSSGASQLAGGADVSFATRRRSFWDEGILNNSHVVRGVHAEDELMNDFLNVIHECMNAWVDDIA